MNIRYFVRHMGAVNNLKITLSSSLLEQIMPVIAKEAEGSKCTAS
jgi:hypothetical protein